MVSFVCFCEASVLCSPLSPNLASQSVTTSYSDTNAAPLAPLFYRVGVNAL